MKSPKSLSLSRRDIEFLAKNLSDGKLVDRLTNRVHCVDIDQAKSSEQVAIDFTYDEFEETRDHLGDILTASGTTNGEINALGRYLESLIDVFDTE